jgi:hypothetical protein
MGSETGQNLVSNAVGSQLGKAIHRAKHKVHICIPRVPQCLSPRLNWDSPPPLPQASVLPPRAKKGEGSTHMPVCEGVGESQLCGAKHLLDMDFIQYNEQEKILSSLD